MSSHRVLIVDPGSTVHDLLISPIPCPDARLERVSSGGEALTVAHTVPFDVVVVNAALPDMDGLALLSALGTLLPGARIVLVGESCSPEFVLEALRRRAYAALSRPVSAHVLADLARQACESTSWEDDVELVSGNPQWISLGVRCRLEVADRVVSILREMLCGVPRPACEDIVAAARELLMNAIEHGGNSDPTLRTRISLVRGQRAVVCLIEDPGHGFSFDALTHAAIANPPGDPTHHIGIRGQHRQRPGGFGILMTRNLVDEVLYNEKGNQVLFVKYLP